MHPVLILIAPPGGIAADRLKSVRAALALAGVGLGPEAWLSPEEAWEAPIVHGQVRAAEEAARLAVAGWPVDVAVLPGEGRKKHLLVADMESTMIENEMLVEMADLAGLGSAMAEETARAMRGECDFKESLRARVRHFAGQPTKLLDRAAARIREMPGARALVATMKAHGATTALVSGGFTLFAEPRGHALGFDRVFANRLLLAGHRIAGSVAEPILGVDEKRALLIDLARESRLDLADTLAVGDGANDVPMLAAAGLGVAFRPKPVAAAAARARIAHGDLTALLFLQGHRRDTFAVA